MNTKLLMTLTALFMGLAGITLSFFPDEILGYFTQSPKTIAAILVLQILGAQYFAFGMINWIAKANLIGGIYGRPIAMGNFCHFAIGALALMKGYFSSHAMTILPIAALYSLLAILFGVVLFTHPVRHKLNTL